jgi:membrane-associated phospholipid phosphatase
MTPQRRLILLALGFAALEALLILFIDRPLSDFMRALDSTHHALIDFFRAYTDYAKSKWYLWPSAFGILACALLLRTPIAAMRRAAMRRAGHNLLFLFASIALSGIATDIIKPILGRARPVEILRDHLYGFRPFTFHAAMNGMPSGHATTAAALAATLVILYPRGRIFWLILGAALGLSRVMVNAHYLSDVVAGTLVGGLVTLVVARFRDAQGMFPFAQGIFPIDRGERAP